MRRITVIIAIAAVSLFLGLGSAASAQTATSLPLAPGQGGPDNGINPNQAGNAPGGGVNPASNAGPAVAEDDGSSLTPWLIGAAVLVFLVAGGALVARRVNESRTGSTYSGRTA